MKFNGRKEEFIFEVQEFIDNYKHNKYFLKQVKKTRKLLFELQEIYFHLESPEERQIVHTDTILFYLQNMLEKTVREA
jgi:tmRNA-binding protein